MPKRATREAPSPGVVTKTRPKEEVKPPPLYKVLFHNDDYTTMEFVVWVLQTVFHHDEATATSIMLHIHRTGIGVAGTYPYDIAETRASRVEALAREQEYPLRCTVEPD
jgi:ATP-dependent Clp protease adaptor protein ClpS